MIKCPQCHTHNSDDHRFCQQCGLTLTQKPCAHCGYFVDFEVTHCPQCTHPTATIWRTFLTPLKLKPQPTISEDNPAEGLPETLSAQPTDILSIDLQDEPSTQELLDTIDKLVNASAEEQTSTEVEPDPPVALIPKTDANEAQDSLAAQSDSLIQNFLAKNPRYRLLEEASQLDYTLDSPPSLPIGHQEFNLLDTQPFHMSPLTVALNQLQETGDPIDISKPGILKNYLDAQLLPFPGVLEPYLALRQQFPLLLPHVHDAWQSEQQSVVLLENRTQLPSLKDVISGDLVLPTQVLHWLQQTLNFVSACSPWHCASSVLHIKNLRVDPGKNLCLQWLILKPILSRLI